MLYRKLVLSVSVGVLASCSSLFAGSNLSKGESIFKDMINKLATSSRIGCKLNFDAKSKNKSKLQNISGIVKVAFDSRDLKNDRKKIEINTAIGGNAIKVILNTIGEDAYFVANLPGQPPMAYHLDSSGATKGGKTPQGFGGPNMGGANPLSSVMGKVGKGMTTQERKKMADEAFANVKKKTNITYIAPNCLKFLPRDSSKVTTKLYFDPSTKLAKTVLISDPKKGANAKIVFSNWILNSSVDTKLVKARNSYLEFDQQAMGRLVGAGMGLMAGAQGGGSPFSSSAGFPASGNLSSGTSPKAPSSGGFTFPSFGGAVNGGNAASSGGATGGNGAPSSFNFPSFGATKSGKTIDGAIDEAAAGMKNAGKQLSDIMKQFNSSEFQEKMRKAKDAAVDAQKYLSSSEFKNQVKGAQKSVSDAQKQLSSPEFKEQMRKAQEAALAMQKKFEEQMKTSGQ